MLGTAVLVPDSPDARFPMHHTSQSRIRLRRGPHALHFPLSHSPPRDWRGARALSCRLPPRAMVQNCSPPRSLEQSSTLPRELLTDESSTQLSAGLSIKAKSMPMTIRSLSPRPFRGPCLHFLPQVHPSPGPLLSLHFSPAAPPHHSTSHQVQSARSASP